MISASPSLTSTSLKIGYPKNLVSIEPPCISSMAFVWYFEDLWAHFQMIHIVGPLKSPVNLPIAPLMVDCSHTSCTDCCTLVTSASTAKTSPCPEMFWGHNKLGLTSLLKEENNDFDPVNPLLGQYHIQTIFNFRWGCPDKISGKKHPFFGCYIWVNYNNSLTWNKAIWGWFPLLFQWGRSEVVIIYPDIYIYTHVTYYVSIIVNTLCASWLWPSSKCRQRPGQSLKNNGSWRGYTGFKVWLASGQRVVQAFRKARRACNQASLASWSVGSNEKASAAILIRSSCWLGWWEVIKHEMAGHSV
jgi:hypothetical protein